MKQNAKKHHTNHSFSRLTDKIGNYNPKTMHYHLTDADKNFHKDPSKHPPQQTRDYAGPADTDGPYTLCACTILHYEAPLAMLAGRPQPRQRQPAWPSTQYNAMLGFYIYHWGKNINPYQPQAPYCRMHHTQNGRDRSQIITEHQLGFFPAGQEDGHFTQNCTSNPSTSTFSNIHRLLQKTTSRKSSPLH